jgi:hypothetical protein
MKVLLGATIILLALVSLGLVVYAQTEHREVAYLTLRAGYLENRIIDLETSLRAAHSVGEEEQATPEAGTSTSIQVIALSEDGEEKSQGSYCDRHPHMRACLPYVKDGKTEAAQSQDAQVEALIDRVEESGARLEALRWTEAEAIAVVQYRVWARVWDCDNHSRHEDGMGCYPHQDSILQVTPDGFLGPYLVKVILQRGEWSAKYEPDSYRWRIEVEASGQDVQPLVFHAYEKTGLVVGVVPPE